MLYLKEAGHGDIEKEWLFVKDMPQDENGMTNPWHGISRQEFETKALPDMIRFSKGIDLPEWMVPETFFFLWEDDTVIGHFRIRHYLNEALRTGAGHIGYCIRKGSRGRGYGTQGLRLTLEKARDIVPEDEFCLRVNKDNPASLKVMLKNGGRIVSESEDKYFVRIANPGRQ
ncbi:MAG: GNAT family N-acetyltransferase [Solobacterium sp.]|nr:GNAT family N-acetyltransferase [Solobacterium sp.]